jgi:hypothetical protein
MSFFDKVNIQLIIHIYESNKIEVECILFEPIGIPRQTARCSFIAFKNIALI